MQVTTNKEGTKLTVTVEGHVDTTTAPQLQQTLSDNMDGVTELIIDFAGVSYISSAGLRVLLVAQKQMNTAGSMELHNVNDVIMEIFDVTGFTDILTIK